MKLFIRQHVFKLTDTYDIFDENGNIKYFAKCDFTLFLHRLRVYENDVQIGYVEQKLKWMLPEFSFYLGNEFIGNIVQEFTFLRPRYVLNFNNWIIQGDFLGLDYQVIEGTGKTIMTFSKEIFTFSDQYCLNILDPNYEKLCLLIALAVDMAVCSTQDN